MENAFFAEGTCVLTLQFCPIKRTLFAAAGFPKRSVTDDSERDYTSEKALPGVWCVDKVMTSHSGYIVSSNLVY